MQTVSISRRARVEKKIQMFFIYIIFCQWECLASLICMEECFSLYVFKLLNKMKNHFYVCEISKSLIFTSSSKKFLFKFFVLVRKSFMYGELGTTKNNFLFGEKNCLLLYKNVFKWKKVFRFCDVLCWWCFDCL